MQIKMIPTYEEIMLPLLKSIEDVEEHELNELIDKLTIYFKLSDIEQRELLPSGRQPIFRNRVGWATTYLKKAGLLSTPRRAHFKILERGLILLKENPKEITSRLLSRYDEFIEFKTLRRERKDEGGSEDSVLITNTNQTPEEVLEYAFQKLKSELAKEILEVVKKCSPTFFEKLVIDLLLKMGYGGSRNDAGQAIGKSGDGGIDGIIKEDKLGLDIIYIQAKRWENTVPVKELRDFVGALSYKKAKKGIFITTSYFPSSAYDFVKQIEHKIILIDGNNLADLMVENGIGVSTINTYDIKKIDTDYFEES
jgi:restriction system protein